MISAHPRITKMDCQLSPPFRTSEKHLHCTEGSILVKLIWLTAIQLMCYTTL